MAPIKMLFADDQPLVCESIPALLREEPSVYISAVAPNGQELLRLVEQHRPDLVLTDIEMPVLNGIEATRFIKKQHPQIAVLGITMFDDEYRIQELMEAGADGYVSKATANRKELVEAIHTVHRGRIYFSVHTSPRLSKMMGASKKQFFRLPTEAGLTEKELEIMRHICRQKTSKEIAPEVGLTARSVEFYREQILEKIGAQNAVGIAIYAIQNGIFKI